MITEKQKAAARLNGAKSRGPKTAAGKRRSSRNGCKHNLYSRNPLPMPDESREDFAELLAGFRADLQPHTPAAESAVYQAALNMWLMWEIIRIETSLLKAETARLAALEPGANPWVLIGDAYQNLPMIRLAQFQGRHSRRFYRVHASSGQGKKGRNTQPNPLQNRRK